MIKYRVIAISETGAVRDNNEDNLYLNGEWRHGSEVNVPYWHYLEKTTDASLFVVCDGMGGESYGEEASLIAVSGLSAIEDRLIRSSKEDFATLIQSYLLMVNNEICERVRSHHGLRMGTTFASLFIRKNKARCINLGDSRIYLYRDRDLKQLTVDQTQAQKLADLGLISQAEVKMHPEHNRLVQHLGIFPNEYNLEPALSPEIELQVGDSFLLCSDGLTDMLSDEAIAKVLEQSKDIKLAAEDLVQKSILAGGKDNITVILIQVDAFNDERLTKTGKLQVIDPKLALANEQLMAQEALKKQETRQDPLLRLRLNRAIDEQAQQGVYLSDSDVKLLDTEAEIKTARSGLSKLDLLKHPYQDLAAIEELQALKEAELAFAANKLIKTDGEKQNLYREVVEEKSLLDLESLTAHKFALKNAQVANESDEEKEPKAVAEAAELEATRRISNLTSQKANAKSSSVVVSRVQGFGENASSLSFFNQNRAPIQPITTDDLDRFNQARQAAMQRQQEFQGKESLENKSSDSEIMPLGQVEQLRSAAPTTVAKAVKRRKKYLWLIWLFAVLTILGLLMVAAFYFKFVDLEQLLNSWSLK